MFSSTDPYADDDVQLISLGELRMTRLNMLLRVQIFFFLFWLLTTEMFSGDENHLEFSGYDSELEDDEEHGVTLCERPNDANLVVQGYIN